MNIGRSSLTLLVLGAAVAACGDGTGPRGFTASYSLTSVNGAAPPALVAATVSCDQYLNAALIQFSEDGAFDLAAELTLDCTRAGGQQTPQTLTLSGTYTRLGPRITLQVPGAPPLTATITSDALTGTLPASPVTFPIDLILIFARLLPA
jgi:hypothetical protein